MATAQADRSLDVYQLLGVRHNPSVGVKPADMVQSLQNKLGIKMTARMMGVRHLHVEDAWTEELTELAPVTARKLVAAYNAFEMIEAAEGPSMARAWMIGMNPWMDDLSPVEAIAQGDCEDVVAAARVYSDCG
ncbi:XRE family transcriptional regulator [Streptomyces sp. NPDC001663]|uniref:XRE family transcriptional regulator n=1 Tax=Streptomyces sp. NPDC001663 TaxID=3364597 RepID=UPI0036B7A645